MRLGLIIYGSLDTVSGGYLYDRKLVEHLERNGHEIEIISLPWRGYLRNLADNLSSDLLESVANLHLDLLLQDELNHVSLAWQNRRLRKALRIPLIAIVHHMRCSESNPGWQNYLYRHVERHYLDSVDGYIFNSQATRKSVKAIMPKTAPHKPDIVAHPAGDHLQPKITMEEIKVRSLRPGSLHLVYLGNLISRKGLHQLLAALAKLPAKSWELDVAGSLDFDPSYVRRVRRETVRLGLADRVRFLGALEDSNLAALLRSCQVMVVPSSHEGFGIAYLEGFGFGLPAVAGIGGATGEIITHAQDGFLVDPHDTDALAGCLAMLVDNRSRLVEMSLAARHRYLVHPSWEQSTTRIHQFLLSFHDAST